MICRIFSSKAFKLGDIGRELGWQSRPTSVMVYRVIDQLVKIGKTEACHIGEQGSSRVVLVAVPLVVFPTLGPGLPPKLSPEPDRVKVTRGEPGAEPEGEPNEPEEESECGLGGGLTRILHRGTSIPIGN